MAPRKQNALVPIQGMRAFIFGLSPKNKPILIVKGPCPLTTPAAQYSLFPAFIIFCSASLLGLSPKNKPILIVKGPCPLTTPAAQYSLFPAFI
ncbi:MAG: hypothetical protein IKC02_08380, partial [Oscillospiraceae bacterium]|nr:hypothetical protein [Oscillospiraceae bacterium]